jgi:hypothetical protein
MTKFLVCYDYGTGGLWAYIPAPSSEAITEKFPDLKVFVEPPSWWNAQEEAITRTYLLERLGQEWPGAGQFPHPK